MKALGVDGHPRGWIAVWIDKSGHRGFETISAIDEILKYDAAVTLIDIPIGLPETGYRACDRAARSMLGNGRSRVFLGMRRPLLRRCYIDEYAAANAWGKKSDRKGVAKQTHAILPKIAEVDALMLPDRQARIRETHPELVFRRLWNDSHLDNKKTDLGRRQRRTILLNNGFDNIDEWLSEIRGSGARADDLFDACGAAIAAMNPKRLECVEETDARGLRMEMWY